MRIPKLLKPRLLLHASGYSGLASLFVLIFAVATLAQVPRVNFIIEAEDGTLQGNVSTAQDGTASDGALITFSDNTPPPSGGTFTDAFSNLDNWSFGHWRVETPGEAQSGSSGSVVNGRAVITTADQNYGDATLRANRLYDVRNGGTFTFDVSLQDGNLPATGAFIGYPFVAFADQPVNTPSYYDDNGKGTGLRNGGYYQFFHTCALPWQAGHARQFINYVESVMPGEESCAGQVTITEGQLNRVELRYNGNNGWELWASNAGTTSPLTRLRTFTMQIPEVGYFLLGSHNHASLKYSNNSRATANATFDNVSYPAGGYSSSFRNGANVVKGAAVTAHVSFNGYVTSTTGSFSVTINGTNVPFTPHFRDSRSSPVSVEVPLSAVRDGANTITIQGFTTTANLDLVLTRNTP